MGFKVNPQDDEHKNKIQIMSWSWGASQVSSVAGTGGSGAGKAGSVRLQHHDLFRQVDARSSSSRSVPGTHIKTGTMSAIKSGADGKPYLKVDFKELFVSGLQISGSSEIPTVSLSFTYNEIKIDYSTQDEKGNLTSTGPVTYNTKENKLS